MKETSKGRKSQNRNRQLQNATFQLAEKDAWQVQLNAYAIGSVVALQDFPDDVLPTGEVLESAARFALVARLPELTLSREYDMFTLATVFVPAFCKAYCLRIVDYQADLAAHKRDKMYLGEWGGWHMLNAFIEVGYRYRAM